MLLRFFSEQLCTCSALTIDPVLFRERSWLPSSAKWRWVGRAPARTLRPPPCTRLPQLCCPSTLLPRPATLWPLLASQCRPHQATNPPLVTRTLHHHPHLHPSPWCRPRPLHKATCSPSPSRYVTWCYVRLYMLMSICWCSFSLLFTFGNTCNCLGISFSFFNVWKACCCGVMTLSKLKYRLPELLFQSDLLIQFIRNQIIILEE